MDFILEQMREKAKRASPKDPESGLPKKYVSGLKGKEKKQQIEAIKETKEVYEKTGKVMTRPKLGTSKRSPHVVKFEKLYGYSITNLSRVKKDFPGTDVDKILAKGRAAYASGSRPGQTPESWAYARLASVLTGGKSLYVDKDLVSKEDLRRIQKV